MAFQAGLITGKAGRSAYEHIKVYTKVYAGCGRLWEAGLWIWKSGDRAGASALQSSYGGWQSDFKVDWKDGDQHPVLCEQGRGSFKEAGEGSGRPGLCRAGSEQGTGIGGGWGESAFRRVCVCGAFISFHDQASQQGR